MNDESLLFKLDEGVSTDPNVSDLNRRIQGGVC